VQRVSVAALLAAAGAGYTDVLYLWTINAEGEGELGSSRVIFVAICLGVAALLAIGGAVVRHGVARLVLLAFASFLLLLITILGALSIGILLVIPTVLALRSAGLAARTLPASRAWLIVALAAVADVALVAFGVAGTS
jgi:hypothetical protein